jgi:hypothetical protein
MMMAAARGHSWRLTFSPTARNARRPRGAHTPSRRHRRHCRDCRMNRGARFCESRIVRQSRSEAREESTCLARNGNKYWHARECDKRINCEIVLLSLTPNTHTPPRRHGATGASHADATVCGRLIITLVEHTLQVRRKSGNAGIRVGAWRRRSRGRLTPARLRLRLRLLRLRACQCGRQSLRLRQRLRVTERLGVRALVGERCRRVQVRVGARCRSG